MIEQEREPTFNPTVRLVSPDTNLEVNESGFRTPKVRSPLGPLHLVGQRTFEFTEDQPAFAIIEGTLVEGNAAMFYDMGLHLLEVQVSAPPDPSKTLYVSLIAPDGKTIRSHFFFNDDDEIAVAKGERFGYSQDQWHLDNSDEETYLFGPCDSQVLSQLRFSFSAA